MWIVEMHRIPPPPDGHDLFDCPGNHWDALRKLGASYGWRPQGTLPHPHIDARRAEAEERSLAELRATVPPDLDALRRKAVEERKARSGGGILFVTEYDKYDWLDLYLPRDWCGVPRMVTAGDARAWAEALDRCLQDMEALSIDLPHEGPAVLNTTSHADLNGVMNGGLSRAFIQEFSAYLRRGAFGFAWDD